MGSGRRFESAGTVRGWRTGASRVKTFPCGSARPRARNPSPRGKPVRGWARFPANTDEREVVPKLLIFNEILFAPVRCSSLDTGLSRRRSRVQAPSLAIQSQGLFVKYRRDRRYLARPFFRVSSQFDGPISHRAPKVCITRRRISSWWLKLSVSHGRGCISDTLAESSAPCLYRRTSSPIGRRTFSFTRVRHRDGPIRRVGRWWQSHRQAHFDTVDANVGVHAAEHVDESGLRVVAQLVRRVYCRALAVDRRRERASTGRVVE